VHSDLAGQFPVYFAEMPDGETIVCLECSRVGKARRAELDPLALAARILMPGGALTQELSPFRRRTQAARRPVAVYRTWQAVSRIRAKCCVAVTSAYERRG